MPAYVATISLVQERPILRVYFSTPIPSVAPQNWRIASRTPSFGLPRGWALKPFDQADQRQKQSLIGTLRTVSFRPLLPRGKWSRWLESFGTRNRGEIVSHPEITNGLFPKSLKKTNYRGICGFRIGSGIEKHSIGSAHVNRSSGTRMTSA